MELIRECSSLSRAYPGSSLTIGNFDGVHLGHQQIIGRAVESARAVGTRSVVFTFDPHPAAILHPERTPDRILTLQRKLSVMEELGVDVVVCPAEPRPVLAMEAEDFASQVIAGRIGAGLVVEGVSFAFGRGGRGNTTSLSEWGRMLGFRVEVVRPVLLGEQEISSTRIRRAVAEGNVEDAARMLGRPFEFVGQVVHGHRRGHSLGFPTVNLTGDFLMPAEGVYAGRAHLPEGVFGAAISVGRAETFGDVARPVVEAYLLDFDEEIYDRYVRLEIVKRLRGQVAFASAEALSTQISADCEAVRKVLRVR